MNDLSLVIGRKKISFRQDLLPVSKHFYQLRGIFAEGALAVFFSVRVFDKRGDERPLQTGHGFFTSLKSVFTIALRWHSFSMS